MTRSLTQTALADLADVPATGRWVTTAAGVRLHVLDYGPADAVPVLVVPGITSPAIAMDFVARELSGVRPVVLDVRGRGFSDDAPPRSARPDAPPRRSARPDAPPRRSARPDGERYDLATYADDVEAVVRGLDLDRPILLGHSMGARIAALAATRLAVRGTVLVDPPMSGPGRGPYPTTLEAFLGQLAEAQRGTDADEVARAWPRWPRREQELRARWLASCSEEAIRATHAGFETEDFFAVWPHVPAPTVLIHGGDSPVVTAEGAREAAAANPKASVVEVPGTGHMVFWDDPAAGLAAAQDAITTLL